MSSFSKLKSNNNLLIDGHISLRLEKLFFLLQCVLISNVYLLTLYFLLFFILTFPFQCTNFYITMLNKVNQSIKMKKLGWKCMLFIRFILHHFESKISALIALKQFKSTNAMWIKFHKRLWEQWFLFVFSIYSVAIDWLQHSQHTIKLMIFSWHFDGCFRVKWQVIKVIAYRTSNWGKRLLFDYNIKFNSIWTISKYLKDACNIFLLSFFWNHFK